MKQWPIGVSPCVAAINIRPREGADLAACVEVARRVHELDGYPAYLPTDLGAFLATPGAIGAWVALAAENVVGHVALHPSSSPAVMRLACKITGLPAECFGVVARLLVAPESRGLGIGGLLLDTAAAAARSRNLQPVLDVHTTLHAAVRLYERSRWVRAGELTVQFGAGTLDEYLYLAPASPPGAPGAS